MVIFLIIATASTLGIAILIWKWIYKRQFSISIPAFVIQKSVNAALPIATEAGGFDLQISEVSISLIENNRIHISTAVSADKNIFTAKTELQLSASLVYRDAKLYLSRFAIEKLIIGKIALHSSQKITPTENTWTSALHGAIKAFNVEEKADILTSGYRAALEKILMSTGETAISALLEHIPVYVLPSDSILARLTHFSILSIEIVQDKIMVIFGKNKSN